MFEHKFNQLFGTKFSHSSIKKISGGHLEHQTNPQNDPNLYTTIELLGKPYTVLNVVRELYKPHSPKCQTITKWVTQYNDRYIVFRVQGDGPLEVHMNTPCIKSAFKWGSRYKPE